MIDTDGDAIREEKLAEFTDRRPSSLREAFWLLIAEWRHGTYFRHKGRAAREMGRAYRSESQAWDAIRRANDVRWPE